MTIILGLYERLSQCRMSIIFTIGALYIDACILMALAKKYIGGVPW